MTRAVIAVASIPAAHPYVAAVVATGDDILLLDDPRPLEATTPGQWWPPRLLEPDYLRAHIDDIDVVHLHFGFDAATPDRLADVVSVLRESSTPLVLTVHDLHNPHFAELDMHRSQLDVLVPAAAAVITLTDRAAREIERLWGRSAMVIPHPHVAPLGVIAARDTTAHERAVVAVHAKSLRANLDPEAVMSTVVAAASARDAVVRLDIDDDVFDHTSHWYAPERGERLLAFRDHPDVDVRVHRRFTDAELWQYLSEIDVSVLPYRFGTHSGWMEACRDLGVVPVVPDIGHFADQFPCPTFVFGPGLFDPASLDAAVGEALRTEPTGPDFADYRRHQQSAIAAEHAALYRALSAPVASGRADGAVLV
ncbi:hypothetical protein HQ305_00755 [Rhodococcus sp. BP-149]|nr:hypothetical protein [Rhodococcus sp. BP-288]MBY6692465.1 hypothetical protein [Rhodococcus sp. BP-188]MBY6698363.1 hypothetical protein [Rhodococcus sp. BP-285]MBY6701042.1 hypothetical protein [Rhodococcus sp. BP-283]MBY6712043.1 hypothetical protein [Rhodococcus sp. BP-160]MBY6714591.1 hypothetical protein [Rhodococcus sp. BP-110]MBY6720115.1 hypothetical protein [Rhodococcus sp. BP-142]MBY6722572.1 hypothetical protein [Rhodococcus sp. BP-149]MBY6728889.1 hypothetical protein [Rhodoc